MSDFNSWESKENQKGDETEEVTRNPVCEDLSIYDKFTSDRLYSDAVTLLGFIATVGIIFKTFYHVCKAALV